MNCRDVEKFVYVYLDEEFDKRESLEFEAHVSECTPCRQLVREEEHFRLRLRNQLRHQDAPAALRARIQLALGDPSLIGEAEAGFAGTAEVVTVEWSGRSSRIWMGGALAAGLAAIAVWSGTSAVHGDFQPGETPAVNVSTSLPLPLPPKSTSTSSRATPDPFDETLEDTTVEALQLHSSDLPLDVQGDTQVVERFLRLHFRDDVVPPLAESCTTRLLGARIVAAGPSPVVQFIYDHHGRRLSAVQRLLPQSEPGMMRTHRVARRNGYNTILFGQNESVLTAVVTDLPSTDVDHLVVAGGYSR